MNAGVTGAVARLAGFSLTTPDADRLARFYAEAFDCAPLDSQRLGGAAFETLTGVGGGARSVRLALGAQIIELLQFETPGRPCPAAASASDIVFQHFAIVVADMARAYARLSAVEGWSPISTDGPQRLPASSGGVSAFKFRDPDGHPLELLAFPEGQTPPHWRARGGALFLGVDHSAIGVADTGRSEAFYAGLGFAAVHRSLNRGAEQARLDGVREPEVEVTALAAAEPTPHLELLCYRGARHASADVGAADIAATRLVLETTGDGASTALSDPDGHRLIMRTRRRSAGANWL